MTLVQIPDGLVRIITLEDGDALAPSLRFLNALGTGMWVDNIGAGTTALYFGTEYSDRMLLSQETAAITVGTSITWTAPSVFVNVGSTGWISTQGTLVTDGFGTAIVKKTSGYSVTAADSTILCDATSGGFSVTLPAAPTRTGQMYHIKKIDSSSNIVTVDGNGKTIDDGSTATISTQYTCLTVQWDGTEWWII